MRPLVDGHNALFALGFKGGDHASHRRALCIRVAAVAPNATVFFDARNSPQVPFDPAREGGVRVVYCRRREADEEILDTVRDSNMPHALLVVTNDRELTGRAAQLGAKTARVEAFLAGQFPHGDGGAARKAGRKNRRLPKASDFKPEDFGLPEEVDLTDPDWED